MKYLISCRIAKSPSEICQSIYYFTGFNDEGAMLFNTSKSDAMLFSNLDLAELHRRILVGQSCILGCTIEQLTT